MTIQSFSVARPPRPGCPPRNTSQRKAITESKIAKNSLPGKKFTTSYRDDFCKREFSKQASSKPPDNLTRSGTKFNTITTYQASYGYQTPVGTQRPKYPSSQRPISDALHNTAKAAQPSKLQVAIHAPNEAAQEAGDAGSTPLRVEGKKLSLVASVKHLLPPYNPPEGTMQFVTSYASEYQPWGDQRRVAILQQDKFAWAKGPFQHTTTYRVDYTLKTPPPTPTKQRGRR
ncbi:hypothetical protein GJAV_G00203560 [Gymnothorax javanicus]|nr:hypothetical protein GJAV_G00203560 [Gymnothorax javanicus]